MLTVLLLWGLRQSAEYDPLHLFKIWDESHKLPQAEKNTISWNGLCLNSIRVKRAKNRWHQDLTLTFFLAKLIWFLRKCSNCLATIPVGQLREVRESDGKKLIIERKSCLLVATKVMYLMYNYKNSNESCIFSIDGPIGLSVQDRKFLQFC